MCQKVVRSFIVFLPFVCLMSWSSLTQGCAHADDEDSSRGDETNDASEAHFFPTDQEEDSAPSASDAEAEHDVMLFEPDDGGDHVAFTPNPHIDVAFDSGQPDFGQLDSGAPDAAMNDTNDCVVPVSLAYAGPSSPGSIWVEAWWQPPSAAPRAWGPIPECADSIPGDGKLNCTFPVPCSTTSLEFQIYLPDIRYWGDESPTGGNGSTIGTVLLATPTGNLSYVMIPNPWGIPYMNGFVASVK